MKKLIILVIIFLPILGYSQVNRIIIVDVVRNQDSVLLNKYTLKNKNIEIIEDVMSKQNLDPIYKEEKFKGKEEKRSYVKYQGLSDHEIFQKRTQRKAKNFFK
jgi:hypothetical protein